MSWRECDIHMYSALSCTSVESSISLNISQTLVPSSLPQFDYPFEFNVTGMVTGKSITSTATANATADLNGTLVLCEDGNLILPKQNTTIRLRGEHAIADIIYAIFATN